MDDIVKKKRRRRKKKSSSSGKIDMNLQNELDLKASEEKLLMESLIRIEDEIKAQQELDSIETEKAAQAIEIEKRIEEERKKSLSLVGKLPLLKQKSSSKFISTPKIASLPSLSSQKPRNSYSRMHLKSRHVPSVSRMPKRSSFPALPPLPQSKGAQQSQDYRKIPQYKKYHDSSPKKHRFQKYEKRSGNSPTQSPRFIVGSMDRKPSIGGHISNPSHRSGRTSPSSPSLGSHSVHNSPSDIGYHHNFRKQRSKPFLPKKVGSYSITRRNSTSYAKAMPIGGHIPPTRQVQESLIKLPIIKTKASVPSFGVITSSSSSSSSSPLCVGPSSSPHISPESLIKLPIIKTKASVPSFGVITSSSSSSSSSSPLCVGPSSSPHISPGIVQRHASDKKLNWLLYGEDEDELKLIEERRREEEERRRKEEEEERRRRKREEERRRRKREEEEQRQRDLDEMKRIAEEQEKFFNGQDSRHDGPSKHGSLKDLSSPPSIRSSKPLYSGSNSSKKSKKDALAVSAKKISRISPKKYSNDDEGLFSGRSPSIACLLTPTDAKLADESIEKAYLNEMIVLLKSSMTKHNPPAILSLISSDTPPHLVVSLLSDGFYVAYMLFSCFPVVFKANEIDRIQHGNRIGNWALLRRVFARLKFVLDDEEEESLISGVGESFVLLLIEIIRNVVSLSSLKK
ncbi:hypothetical protein ADUPG1_000461 [Aduncisulcus paluster]|uniref:Calponin-homology (CH) domain-containing protein n=1 Tax=Aduncisulcus paluster TaxID=2918883 RepID=A0ABQ5KAE3_9EUKA|nr:hypothetical protein ADUPG1_000461 [Aduncisulcus paluster]